MPDTPYCIQRLGPADAALVHALNLMFAEAFGDRATYAGAPPGAQYCAEVLAKEHVIALVALERGEVIGGLVAYALDKLERARSEVYVYDLAVAEAHRRRGVATGLIERLRAVAHQRGAWVAFVQADHGDDAAIALYQKLGAREDVMHFDIPVP